MKYPSKQDWWLTIIVWGAMLFAMGSGIYTLMESKTIDGEAFIAVAFSILLPLFILWLWLTTYYLVEENQLVVKYGPFKKVVPYRSIKSIKKSLNPLSSPALSFKRIEIIYGDYQTVLISPKDRDEFINILAQKCPQAKME